MALGPVGLNPLVGEELSNLAVAHRGPPLARSASRARVMRSRSPPSCTNAASSWRSCWSRRQGESSLRLTQTG